MNDCKVKVVITGLDEAIEKAKTLEQSIENMKNELGALQKQIASFSVTVEVPDLNNNESTPESECARGVDEIMRIFGDR